MNRLQGLLRNFVESKWNSHFAFIILFLTIFCLPSIIIGLPVGKVSRVIVYAIFLLLCMYAGRWGCRKWLLSNEYQKYISFSCLAAFVLIATGMLGSSMLTNNSLPVIFLTVTIAVVLFFSLGTFFSITRSTILRQLKQARIMQEQKESELRLLKSQLSPHFLFNVLNNLYGLSLKGDDKVPTMLLKLSALLRYSLYDTGNHFVPLQSELDCMENYIELERMRIGSRLVLEMNLSKENINDTVIAPMLLIVFAENAFKHSAYTKQKNAVIKIDFRMVNDWIDLVVKNSVPDEPGSPGGITNACGIGLSVTKKRLELLYPNKHTLEISSDKCFYEIKLKIKTK
jgi:sensor histidine kinase YesM